MNRPPPLHFARLAAVLATAVACLAAGCSGRPEVETIAGLAQGTTYTVQWWSGAAIDVAGLRVAVTSELEEIDELLSNYRSDSVLERFNAVRNTDPQALPPALVTLLVLARDVHSASDGCFDPTVRPLVHLWGFDGDEPRVPADDDVARARARVGFEKIELIDAEHARKLDPEVEIDMASIGQGYTVGRLAAVAERFGIEDYLVEIGGELAGRGQRPDGRSWRVGVEGPEDGAPLRALPLPPGVLTAVITSGTYRHFFEDHGKTYGHILDPRTGRPVDHALAAVTVAGPNPALAAAWGTALLCLGPDAGLALADKLDIAALLSVRSGEGFEQRATPRFSAEWPDERD